MQLGCLYDFLENDVTHRKTAEREEIQKVPIITAYVNQLKYQKPKTYSYAIL